MAGRVALFSVTLGLASCAHADYSVIARSDPQAVSLPPDKLDRVRVGWFAHSGSMGVTTTTRISPSDWVDKRSIRVESTPDTITVCYSIVPRPGKVRGEPPEPITLTFVVPGIERSDSRAVLLSSTCGNGSQERVGDAV